MRDTLRLQYTFCAVVLLVRSYNDVTVLGSQLRQNEFHDLRLAITNI